ncbi:hypothetical protein D3C73_1394450 [compost metagenome]
MLWAADYESVHEKGQPTLWTEPISILKNSEFKTCDREKDKYPVDLELQPNDLGPFYGLEVKGWPQPTFKNRPSL